MCGVGTEVLLMDYEESAKCSICKEDMFGGFGHNAQPINDGRCCDDCNVLVIIERIKEMSNDNARSTR